MGETWERAGPQPSRQLVEQDNTRVQFCGNMSVDNTVYVLIEVLFTMCFEFILHNSHLRVE